MATTIYLTNTASDVSPSGFENLMADVGVRGDGLSTGTADTSSISAVVLTRDTTGDVLLQWITAPLDAVTISGTVTVNQWWSESNMNANCNPLVRLFRADSSGATISTIANIGLSPTSEFAVTTRAVKNWTLTPTSTNISAGERLIIRIGSSNDIGMANGHTFTGSWGATSGGVDGDTFITFTETITEQAVAHPAHMSSMPQLLAH